MYDDYGKLKETDYFDFASDLVKTLSKDDDEKLKNLLNKENELLQLRYSKIR